MKYFFLKAAGSFIHWSLLLWTFMLGATLIVRWASGDDVLSFFSTVGVLVVVGSGFLWIQMHRWAVFWRRIAPSTRQFWFGVFSVHAFSLIFNGLCFCLINKCLGGSRVDLSAFALQVLSTYDFIWLALLLFTFEILTTNDFAAVKANRSPKPLKQVSLFFGLAVWGYVVAEAIVYSRLLGYAFVEGSAIIYFVTSNTFVTGSLRSTLRKKIIFFGSFTILVLAGISFVLVRNNDDSPSINFLGHLSKRHRVTTFADLDSVKGPSAWMQWYNIVDSLTADQLIVALSKLEQLCPPEANDAPARISCIEKKPSEYGGNVFSSSKDEDLKLLLTDNHTYPKILGLLVARDLDQFSPEVQALIKGLAKTSGRLSAVAETTIATHKKGRRHHYLHISIDPAE